MDAKKRRRLIQIFYQLEKYEIELHRDFTPKEILSAYEDFEAQVKRKTNRLPIGGSDGLLYDVWSGADNNLYGTMEEGDD